MQNVYQFFCQRFPSLPLVGWSSSSSSFLSKGSCFQHCTHVKLFSYCLGTWRSAWLGIKSLVCMSISYLEIQFHCCLALYVVFGKSIASIILMLCTSSFCLEFLRISLFLKSSSFTRKCLSWLFQINFLGTMWFLSVWELDFIVFIECFNSFKYFYCIICIFFFRDLLYACWPSFAELQCQ